MSINSAITISKNLDQIMSHYVIILRKMSSLWCQMSQMGLCDVSLVKGNEDMIDRMEETVSAFMEKEIKVEKARQALLDLKSVLDISKKTVEAKSKHLGQEEKQKEETQNIRFKEYQRIHKLQDEKVLLEKEIIPAKRRLLQVKELLEEKNDKMRNIENFHEVLGDHCAQDLIRLKDKTDERRAERHRWDETDLDISNEILSFPLDMEELKCLEKQVCELKDTLQNQKIWYDEELQTKLFYSTRSKEIKHRINHLKTVLRRLEKSGRSEDTEDEQEENKINGRSEHILVDGSPGVQAKEVERYLSHQFNVKVLADYTMLRRLKDEIGVQGLAYLVEKIRLQGHCPVASSSSYVDWEEKRLEKALKNIAMEYRFKKTPKVTFKKAKILVENSSFGSPALYKHFCLLLCREHDENKRLFRVPGVNPGQDQDQEREDRQPLASFSVSSNMTRNTSNTEFSGLSSPTSRRSSNNSLKRKTSLARIKKFLKM